MRAFVVCLLLASAAAFIASAPHSSRRISPIVAAQTPLTNPATGKKMNFAEGSPLARACSSLGVKVTFNCKKGDCGTCTVNVGGKNIRACQGKVPPAPKLKSVLEKGLPVKYVGGR